LEQIFADLGAPSREAVPVAGAVDILAVVPAKPQPAPVVPEPEKPVVKPPAAKKADDAKLAAAETPAAKKKAAEAAKPGKKLEPSEEADAKKASKKGDAKADAKKADAKKAETKKAPSHPSRIWVQIGVGRDKAAIAFDWRKFNKDHAAAFKGRQAYISDVGATNRVLVGPFETQKAASAYLTQLKKADFARGFIWTSPAGQVVDALSGK
jgi:outer membrane biosynthesis protein TonB